MLMQKYTQFFFSLFNCKALCKRTFTAGLSASLAIAFVHSVAADPAQEPLFLSNPVKPIVMLNMSNDHQLYFKIYDDYSDIYDDKTTTSDDGVIERTYTHRYSYYGYFDSDKCYIYDSTDNRFEPFGKTDSDNYCEENKDLWSGNFLNWATMTRIDAVRKILYGGLRSTDTSSTTVLERAFLPHDAHAFAKFYNGTDIGKLTPFSGVPSGLSATEKTGITICNVSHALEGLSQNLTTTPPLIRVAQGNYLLWASNETWQCNWYNEKSKTYPGGASGSNANVPSVSKIYAYTDNPKFTGNSTAFSEANGREYIARVQVCTGADLESNCTSYGSSKKPTGLLQKYGGPSGKIDFGMMSGTYGKNKSGGVLRKNASSMSNEVNFTTDGTFTNAQGIISTLNALRIYGYNYKSGGYTESAAGNDNCNFGLSGFKNGQCTNWGNPQSEIFLESLRYLAGASVSGTYNVDDSAYIPALKPVNWVDPLNTNNYCTPLNVIQFNASTSSYDDDEFADVTSIGMTEIASWINRVGTSEGLSGDYFMGLNGGTGANNTNELCTAKTIGNLSDVRGACPDSPRLKGAYGISGLAHYARTNDIRSLKGNQTVRTYGVALAPAIPFVELNVPGSNKKVTILPACQNKTTTTIVNGLAGQPSQREGNCALVDFKIIELNEGTNSSTGKLYVNWEAAEQGGDYDQDMWGIIDFELTSGELKITTDVLAKSSSRMLGFGYVLSGTKSDGFHAHSGANGYIGNLAGECASGCADTDVATSKTWEIGTSDAKLLEPPLFYAAKWGGYSDDFVEAATREKGSPLTEAELTTLIKNRDTSDSYYFARDPQRLEESLDAAFSNVAVGLGSASAVATSSTRLFGDTFVYQAQFDSGEWNGALYGYAFDSNNDLNTVPSVCTTTLKDADGKVLCTGVMNTSGTGRNIYTYPGTGTNLVGFEWANLSSVQQGLLKLSSEADNTNAQRRVDWLKGNNTFESTAGFRSRGSTGRNILGDIINSSPVYVGNKDFRYAQLPDSMGGASYRDYLEEKKQYVQNHGGRVFVGANDGMLHAFNAKTLEEEFAYIPNAAFSKLANLTKDDYGQSSNPHQYIVDGQIAVGDVYIDGDWRTILVGTLGAGGRSVYALDITEETPSFLFEINTSHYPQLGYIMGDIHIVPMKNGRFAAVFGNGNSSGQGSQLFVIDIEEPLSSTYSKVIDTGAGTGLSTPALLPNAIGQVIAGYAGDIDGNLWRFDLFGASANDWKKDYLLFAATDSSGVKQPITASPTLGLNASKNNTVMVYFGTGKYYDTGDNLASASPQHSFYAIADIGSVVNRASLDAKTISTTYGTVPDRNVSKDNPDWVTQNGWVLDFNDAEAVGERVTTKALLIQDKLIFPTLIPSSSPCQYGGRSWLMEVTAVGDKYVNSSVLDDNLYGEYLILGDIGFGQTKDNGEAKILGSGTDATLLGIDAKYDGATDGRQSWRQVR